MNGEKYTGPGVTVTRLDVHRILTEVIERCAAEGWRATAFGPESLDLYNLAAFFVAQSKGLVIAAEQIRKEAA